jgi:hypothetical protein
MYGGYARHRLVTEDAYALVICHELGHFLGETPKKLYRSGKPAWPSVEGQADYFATLKCLRKVFRKEDNERAIAGALIPSLVREKCSSAFKTKWEIALCARTSLAGISTAAISAEIRNTDLPVVDTPDPSVASETYEAHPLPQCRLDTYFQGSICEVSSTRSLSSEDESKGTCHQALNHIDGVRPACWFKPTK